MAELANVRNSEKYAEAMLDKQDTDADGKLSLPEWLRHLKSVFDKSEKSCGLILGLYEKQISQNRELTSEDWALKAEACRIFTLADKDGNGFIDMAELANVRNSEKYAEAMLDKQDTDADGKLSLPEWLRHLKSVFDKSEKSCGLILGLYEKQISQNRDVTADQDKASS